MAVMISYDHLVLGAPEDRLRYSTSQEVTFAGQQNPRPGFRRYQNYYQKLMLSPLDFWYWVCDQPSL